MPKTEEQYDERRQSGPPTITMSNEQLQLMITGIVNGLRTTNQGPVGSTNPSSGQQTKTTAPLDKSARPGSMSLRPVRANFASSNLYKRRKTIAELNASQVATQGRQPGSAAQQPGNTAQQPGSPAQPTV